MIIGKRRLIVALSWKKVLAKKKKDKENKRMNH